MAETIGRTNAAHMVTKQLSFIVKVHAPLSSAHSTPCAGRPAPCIGRADGVGTSAVLGCQLRPWLLIRDARSWQVNTARQLGRGPEFA